MKKIAFFDTKPYDRTWFDILAKHYEIAYFEEKLNRHTATLTDGFDAVCAFVNDRVDAAAIDRMHRCGVQLLALRCAGFSNVDMQAAAGKLRVVRVPAYSPHAVAEHTMGLLLTLNRRLHRAYIRTRDFNFSIVGLTGIDLYKKTVGIIGTGRIGRAFAEICRGFGMRVLAYDKYPAPDFEYVSLDMLLRESDVISLHCPLTEQTKYILNKEAFGQIKKGAFIINTSRGALIESGARSAEINRVMFDTKSRTAIALLKRVYSDMEFFHGGRCAVLCLTQRLIDETGAQESDLDGVSATVRQVEGVLLGLTIRERGENEYKISLRAAEPANAAEICAQFGGGGHKGAAGCTIHAPLEAVKAQIVEACGRALEGLTPPGPLL